jgi:hypothetical protein
MCADPVVLAAIMSSYASAVVAEEQQNACLQICLFLFVIPFRV